MQGRLDQLERIADAHSRAGQAIWNGIADFFRPAEKPAGLDAFLEELGL